MIVSTDRFFNPHGIAMPKGIYFTAEVYFLLSFFIFSTLNILRIWYDLPRAFTPSGWGQKIAFRGPILNFDRTYLCNGIVHDISLN